MEKRIYDILPDAETLLALEPEEVGGVVLEYLSGLPRGHGNLHRGNFTGPATVQQYPAEYHARIQEALMEGWVWLEREGLIAPQPGGTGEWIFVTRRGREARDRSGVEAYRHASLLPRKLLHPTLVTKCVAEFLRGDYETAVFQAFKEVEIAVRAKGGFAATDLGQALMRKAFDKDKGPLRDQALPEGERDATAHFFAGAIGRNKNPGSHRSVPIDDPGEAVELLLVASHLLRIVDRQTAAP